MRKIIKTIIAAIRNFFRQVGKDNARAVQYFHWDPPAKLPRKPKSLWSGTPGKINFRRSDPRHPMYDALRAAGFRVCWATPQGGVFVKFEGETLSVIEGFRRARLPAPKCLQ